ncbi:hypothetical protein LCGC14_2194060 [marine sediment metagenome]|uniref:Uncharacterized protein n=1 Tax=marine sediment metagenome TaxID=412755 RepID=A0A0F9DIP8_9ZZZZ
MRDDYPVHSKKAPSLQFEEAFVAASTSTTIVCQLCGRTHCGEERDEDVDVEGIEGLVVQERGWAAHGVIDGKQFGEGCPCNGLRKYEDFIWKHRYQIIKYLKGRLQEMQEEVEREAALIGSLESTKED